MKPFLLPYKKGSKGAKALAEALNCNRLKLEGSKFIHRANRCVVNWGNNNPALINQLVDPNGLSLNCQIIGNGELLVSSATNKLNFFNKMNEHLPESIPEYTTDKVVAQQWAVGGHTVVCRKLLNASSGRGIVLAAQAENVIQAPLYTRYKKKKDEYRVHVFCGEVIDIQRKMRKEAVEGDQVNWKVRNTEGGFIFGRNDIEPPEGIEGLAISCISHIGLDFGAVDIIYNARDDKCYLLEVNTAPGITGTTLEKYKLAVSKYCE